MDRSVAGGVPPYRGERTTDLTVGDWVDVLTNASPPITALLDPYFAGTMVTD